VLRASTRQVRDIIASLEQRTDEFKTEMKRSFNVSNANSASREDRIMDLIEEFEDSTDRLRNRFEARGVVDTELAEVRSDAQVINSFMLRNRMTGRAETLWSGIRNDLNTLGGYYAQTWSWDGPVATQPGYPVYSGSESQLRNLIQRIETRTDAFKNRMGNALDRSQYDGRREEREIMDYIDRFEDATTRLRDRFNSRQSTGTDASEVLTRGLYIDRFMSSNAFTRPAEYQWRSIKSDLDTLASYYRVSWNWNQPLPDNNGGFPGGGRGRFLSGTFRLNQSMSDNVANVIDRSLRTVSYNERDRMRRNLERRLASPEMIAINVNGRMVELASSNAPRVSFEADGVSHSETNQRGRTVRTTTRIDRTGLNIAYEGDRMNDFYVTFSPRGDRLNVTRRLYLEERNETITVSSVYDRVSNDADWTAVNSRPDWNPNNNGPISSNDFYIPNGTRLSATLRGTVNTRASQVSDRFVMVVDSPSQYSGAEIEGTIARADNSPRFTGRANVVMNFETIRVNGRTYRFAGIIDGVTAYNGDRITVNNEGAISDRSRTTQTVTRAGIGAALGAIIGAIAGGGSGAAIGAGVGAGVGAGSVLITGRDTIELGPGSRFDITAYAPAGRVGG
jgi:hypothetical protein